jgi:hypothetical protein
VEVTLSNGDTVREELDDVPWLDAKAVTERLHEEMKPTTDPEDARKDLIQRVHGLASSKDCSELFRLFKVAKAI